jgi:hypothetical protein
MSAVHVFLPARVLEASARPGLMLQLQAWPLLTENYIETGLTRRHSMHVITFMDVLSTQATRRTPLTIVFKELLYAKLNNEFDQIP